MLDPPPRGFGRPATGGTLGGVLKHLKIALASIAGFLLVVVILQNTDTVTTRVLSAEIELPRAVLLFVTLGFGYVLGFATAFWRGRRKRNRQHGSSDDREAA